MSQERIFDVPSTYDRIAGEYARRIYCELKSKPMDRALLDRFAAIVGNQGVICDLGCGPGQIARYLKERGARVCGMDLSRGMIECARRLNPGIAFHEGDMRDLPVPDNTWAGITAFYSIVNLAPGDVAQSLREIGRVLAPAGSLLLAFHIGDDTLHTEEDLWGLGVALDTTLFRLRTVMGYVEAAGLAVEEIVEREPYPPEVEYQSRRAYIFAHKSVTKTT